MPPRPLLFSLCLVLVVVGVAVIGVSQIQPPPTGQRMRETIVGELLAGSSAGQTFLPTSESLYAIDVQFGDFLRHNHGPVVFHLKRSPSDPQDLVTLTVDASDLREGVFHRFEFAPLAGVVGKPLYFYLEAPEAQTGNAITVFGTVQDTYADGYAFLANLPYHSGIHDLTFQLDYKQGLQWSLSELWNRLAAHKPWPLGTRAWYPALGAAYLVLLFGLGWVLGGGGGGLLWNSVSDQPDPRADWEERSA